jgi:amino acid permease
MGKNGGEPKQFVNSPIYIAQQQQQHFTAVLRNEERFISIHIDMLWLYSFLHILFFPVDGLLSKRRHLLAHLFPFRLVSNEFPGHSLGVGDTNQPRVSINIQNQNLKIKWDHTK